MELLEEKVNERTRLLVRAKRTWEGTFDAIVDPLAIVDRSFRIVRTNLAHAAVAGRDVRKVNGERCHAVLFGSATPCDGCPVQRTFATLDSAEGEIHDVKRERTYRMWSFPMSSGDQQGRGETRPDQAVCHYKDVTGEKELQRHLLQTEKMAAVGTLSGGVAHEINNPLGAILAFAQLGLQDAAEGSTVFDFLSEIERNALRCKRIVDGLLTFSRPSRGDRCPVRLDEVVGRAVFLCQHQFAKRQVVVTATHADGVPPVIGDANQIEQVLVNLLSNAYGAVPNGGRIHVSTEVRPGERVVLSVEDNGHGISERHLPKIFEPFFTTRPDGKGTGLGLFITYGIVKDHGGTIQVESRVGSGTRFDVTFPWPGSNAATKELPHADAL